MVTALKGTRGLAERLPVVRDEQLTTFERHLPWAAFIAERWSR